MKLRDRLWQACVEWESGGDRAFVTLEHDHRLTLALHEGGVQVGLIRVPSDKSAQPLGWWGVGRDLLAELITALPQEAQDRLGAELTAAFREKAEAGMEAARRQRFREKLYAPVGGPPALPEPGDIPDKYPRRFQSEKACDELLKHRADLRKKREGES